MDVRLYKLAPPVAAPWPGGGTVDLYPIPLADMQRIGLAARGTHALRAGLDMAARAMRSEMTADALAGLVTPAELALLLAHQRRAQRYAEVDSSVLREWLRRSVNDIPDVVEDGIVAWQCEQGPGQYYGCPPGELTSAQVAWFLLLRSAFEHFHVGIMDDKGKMRRAKPRPWWLAQDYEERRKWQIDC